MKIGRNFTDILQYKLENKHENDVRSMQAKQRARRQAQHRTNMQQKNFGSR